MRLVLHILCVASSFSYSSSLYPSATDPRFAKRPRVVCVYQISVWWHNDFVPHKADLTCSACLSFPRRHCSISNPALCLCLITVRHIRRRFLTLAGIDVVVHVRAQPQKLSYVRRTVCFNSVFIGCLLFVLICMIFVLAINYSCFLHTRLASSHFKAFFFFLFYSPLMLSFYFLHSFPSVFSVSGALM